MRLLLLLGVLGLLAILLLPVAARGGAAIGWSAGLLLESPMLSARLRARRRGASLLPAMVGGFLARMSLLLGGTALLQFLAPGWAVAYLVACAAALLAGEGVCFALIGRTRPPAHSDTSP